MEEVITKIHACLISAKGGVTLDNLNRDYMSLEDEYIPYRKLGYSSLDSFISKIPSLRLYQRGGTTYVEVKITEKTSELAQLISKQRAPRKRRTALRMPSRKPTLSNVTLRNNSKPPPRVLPHLSRPQGSLQRPQRPHSTSVTIYPAKHPDQPTIGAKSQQMLHQRLPNSRQSPQSLHTRPKSPPEPLPKLIVPQGPAKPSKSPQTAPIPNETADRQVKRQTSMPQLVSASSKTSKAIPHLKVARPLSDRLRRSPERKVTIVPELQTSDPPSLTSPAPTSPAADITDPREELKILVKRLQLSTGDPEYKNLPNKPKNGRTSYFSQVLVGKHKFNSYPLEAGTPEEAEKLSASSALHQLHRLYGPPIKMRITMDRDMMLQRLIAIVDVHPSGVFEEKLPVFYMDKHNETLPDDWMNFVERCNELSVERGVENAAIICKSDSGIEKSIFTPPPSPSAPRGALPHSNPPPSLPLMVLPVDNLWPVYVSHVASTSEIWIRLLEDKTTEQFYAMCQEMFKHFSSCSPSPCQVQPLHYYVTKVEEEYQRVRVEYVEESGLAECFFLDTGEEDVIDTSLLWAIPVEFLRVPAQAIRASLSRHEEVPPCSTTTQVTREMLVDRALYVQVLNREVDSTSHAIVGVFYDTSSETDEEMNEKIVTEVLRVMQSNQLEVLLEIKGKLLEVFISHIEYNGDVSIQVKNDGFIILNGMMKGLVESTLNDEERVKKARVAGALEPNELYLTQKTDGTWVRVQVAFPGPTNSKLRMVDFGGLMNPDRNKLLRLRDLSEAIAKFPAQAIQVELNNVRKNKFSESSAARLRHLAPPTQLLLCKVVQVREYSRLAVVELFKRSEPDHLLISINNTLDLESELSKNGDGNNNIKPRKRIERTISKSTTGEESPRRLKEPRIPGLGELFEVHVTNSAANPGNFIVQPVDTRERLDCMMKSMQKTYAGIGKVGVEVNQESIYAVQDDDGLWYRAYLDKIIGEQQVTVYLADFGMIRLVGVEQLQLLKKEFFELPYQAIKAKLDGVHPKHGDWSLDSCLRFQELVVNRDFVLKIKKFEQDNSAHNGFVLGVELIDVSSKDVDININKLLIDEHWAIPHAQ